MRTSGDQIEISAGAQRAIIATVGATLREYTVDEHPVIDGFDADEICAGGRGQILMPWPNRVADGRYELAGHRQQLPIDEVELGHAIHGLVRWAEWRVEERQGSRALLRYRLCARPGYPFQLELAVEYRLAESGLTVRFAATNAGDAPCPFGAGMHPYFGFADARADALELCVRADEYLQVDARSIPRGRAPVEGSPVDFRRPRIIGTALLDHAFTGLERDTDGVARVRLCRGRDEICVWMDRGFGFVQVFTGDTLADRARRRHGVAIEPMTCAANAFNSGDGLLMLAPGQSIERLWGVSRSSH